MKLRIAGIANDSIVDGPGLRLTVFTQGCPHRCRGCHNPHTHLIDGGREIETEEILMMIDKNTLLDGVTFSGGEPFLQSRALSLLAAEIKKRELNIITYTGYLFEDIIKDEEKLALARYSDIIIDGRFEEDKKSLSLSFRGSSNQRIIDVKQSLLQNKTVEISFDENGFGDNFVIPASK